MRPFEYAEPEAIDEARALAAKDGAAYKASGIDLLDLMKGGIAAPSRLVSIRRLDAWRRFGEATAGTLGEDHTLTIGSLVTLAALAREPIVRDRAKALADAAAHAATPQVRNVATVGGNLLQRPRCWYFRSDKWQCLRKGGRVCYAQDGENRYHATFDTDPCPIVHPSNLAPALVALGASVELLKEGEAAEALPVERLWISPVDDVTRENILQRDDRRGQLLREVRVPLVPGRRSAYLEAREKQTFDWPVASVAVALDMDGEKVKDCRVVLGAVAPLPRRATACETTLAGKKLTDDLIAGAARSAVQGATPLSQNGYKVAIVEALVRRCIRAAAARK
jgi:xanthine dehydrogenase YagS FAD-binding subunit